jgi:hypothetical protein
LIFQEEIGENNTPHLQGFIAFKTRKRLTQLKKWIPEAHFEVARGSPEENKAYCSKVESRYGEIIEYGDFNAIPTQGKRTDMEDIKEMVLKGASNKEIALTYPGNFVRYHKGINELRRVILPNVEKPTYRLDQFNMADLHGPLQLRAVLIWGESGTGKTEFALSHFESPLLVRHLDELASFDSDTHDGIVFDDMAFLHQPPEARIHLLDYERPSDIHIRYKTVRIPINTKRIFTHNTPEVFWDNENPKSASQRAAMERRLEIVHVENNLFTENVLF